MPPVFQAVPGYNEQAQASNTQALDALQRGAIQTNADATARMGGVGDRVSEALNAGTMNDVGALRSLTARQITAGAAQQDLNARKINAQTSFGADQDAQNREFELQLTRMSEDEARKRRLEAQQMAQRKAMLGILGGAIQTGATIVGGIYGGPAGAAAGGTVGGMANTAIQES